MISKQNILGILKPFENKKTVVIDEQTTNDIIQGILQTHNFYKSEYDKIYKYFVGDSIEETCKNVYDFLKKYVPYYQEPEKKQTLRSPAAIVSKAADCKSYALFSCGILDAYRRNENKNFEVIYRFAGYNNKGIEHVFCVIKNKNKIWFVDNVLPTFDNRSKLPTNYKDYKIKNMALVSLAGINYNQNYTSFGKRVESVGKVPKINGNIYFVDKLVFDQFIEILPKINKAFLYLYIGGTLNPDDCFKPYSIINNYPEVIRKRDLAALCFWQLSGQMDQVKGGKELIDVITESLTQSLGMTPKKFWEEFFGKNSINGINKIGAIDWNTVVNLLSSLGPKVKFEPSLQDFAPNIKDFGNQTNLPKNKNLSLDLIYNQNTNNGGGGNSSNAPAAKNNLLPFGLGAFLLFKFLG
jgi:hypothetical protein